MAKRKNIEATRRQKRDLLIDRTTHILDRTPAAIEHMLSMNLVQSIRINPLKGDVQDTLNEMRHLGWTGEPVSWCENGYTIVSGFMELRDSSLVTEGRIYIQNKSSWLPVVSLNPQPGDAVLDICAAPGGKTSHMAAAMQNTGRLVANDNSRTRLAKLQRNMERLGAHAEYTLYDATRLARTLEGQLFDKILLDAPCSGEGLINLHELKTLDTWSVAHIRRLADLQKKILFDAWKLLRPGGTLVYSTCTMAPEEDEAVIDWLLRRTPDAAIKPITIATRGQSGIEVWNDRKFAAKVHKALRIVPGEGDEAFFVCSLEKLTV
ncbi:MAG TPA: RsmB/NOP family class I SAM-dependent RNA methyltransferase [Candidatus Chromulinivoraceae bacterium]|nr:RsmB/NOP family class I SAM-dependent RNA methyltransferase [Candidatus Chromulinivoraceae bacterium]